MSLQEGVTNQRKIPGAVSFEEFVFMAGFDGVGRRSLHCGEVLLEGARARQVCEVMADAAVGTAVETDRGTVRD
jgi:hypothetical protein